MARTGPAGRGGNREVSWVYGPKAYGYTLTVWGGGAILLTAYGVPDAVEIFLYVAGALTAFAVLAAFTFQSLFTRVETDRGGKQIVASMIHLVASFANLFVSHLFVLLLRGRVPLDLVVWFAVGLQATLAYNLLLVLEEAAARQVARLLPTQDL